MQQRKRKSGNAKCSQVKIKQHRCEIDIYKIAFAIRKKGLGE